jgi:hypothetical protein
MKNTRDGMSDTMSIRQGCPSQISTPRLTPLKMLDRNRNQVVSKDDIDNLESKIRELEDQITTAKTKKPAEQARQAHDPPKSLLTEENLMQHPYLISTIH